MVVLPDADMELTADAAVASGYGSAGERCMAQTLRHRGGRHGRAAAPAHARADREPQGRPGHGARHGHGPDLLGRAPRVGHRAGSTWARPRAPSSSSTAGRSSIPTNPDGFFLGVTLFDHVTPGHGDLPGGDLRARPGHRPRRRRTTRRSASSTATSTPTGPRSSPPTAAPPGASSSRSTCPMIGVNVPIPVPAGYLSFGGREGVRLRRPGHARRGRRSASSPSRRWSPSAGRSPAAAARLSLVFPGNA